MQADRVAHSTTSTHLEDSITGYLIEKDLSLDFSSKQNSSYNSIIASLEAQLDSQRKNKSTQDVDGNGFLA
jgi:hypothetical protein